jgi:hypothetical protein
MEVEAQLIHGVATAHGLKHCIEPVGVASRSRSRRSRCAGAALDLLVLLLTPVRCHGAAPVATPRRRSPPSITALLSCRRGLLSPRRRQRRPHLGPSLTPPPRKSLLPYICITVVLWLRSIALHRLLLFMRTLG